MTMLLIIEGWTARMWNVLPLVIVMPLASRCIDENLLKVLNFIPAFTFPDTLKYHDLKKL